MGIRMWMGLSAAALISGCATQDEVAKQQAYRQNIEQKLEIVRQGSAVRCGSPVQCRKVWDLARTYAQRTAATTIQVENDRVLKTWNPVDYATIGLTVTRVPGAASQSIQIEGACKGMYSLRSDGVMETGPRFNDCALLLLRAYQGMPEFIKREMTR